MTQAFAGGDGRVLGRGLLTLANVITAAAPLAADWNDSHILNERWPSHARFHGVTALAMSTTLSCANIWSIWSGGPVLRGSSSGGLLGAILPGAAGPRHGSQ